MIHLFLRLRNGLFQVLWYFIQNSTNSNILALLCRETNQYLLNTYTEFKKYLSDLEILQYIIISQYTLSNNSIVEWHTFCASESAYGTVYIFIKFLTFRYYVCLLCIKLRVVSFKIINLPCLELYEVLFLSELINKVHTSFHITFASEKYWSDSMIMFA